MAYRGAGLSLAAGLIASLVAGAAPALAHGSIEPVSVAADGRLADFHSSEPALSADGRFVAFASLARNLPGPLGPDWNLFVRDRLRQRTIPVSVGDRGTAQDGWSTGPSLSADGRFVAFVSSSSNLVPGDRNEKPDVFVRDLRLGTTRLVSLGLGGRLANLGSGHAVLSADGRHVAFYSGATNLVAGDRNDRVDVFVRDLDRGTTELASVATTGAPANDASGYLDEGLAISRDGRFVVFASGATDLVPGDANGAVDVFLRDRVLGTTELVSVGPGGAQANDSSGYLTAGLAVSPDGRYVAYLSPASNLVPGDTNGLPDVFVRDRRLHRTTRVSVGRHGRQANGTSGYADATLGLSDDGRFVAFSSLATNLAPGDDGGWSDVFVHDRRTGRTIRVSEGRGGRPGSGDSRQPALSADGRTIAFTSAAEDLQDGGRGVDGTPWDQVLVRAPLR